MLLLLLLLNNKDQETLQIHFGVDNHYINANTLSQSLVNFSTLIRQIDSIINPGYEIEILVEGTGPGSFKIDIRKTLNSLRNNIFSPENFKNFAIGIVTTLVWDLAHPDKQITISTTDKEYILQRDDEKIILPKEAKNYYDSLKRNDSILNSLNKTFETVKQDPKVHYMEFTTPSEKNKGSVYIEREVFDNFFVKENTEELRYQVTNTRLTIIRAVLEKGYRKWQFLWNGIRISAPIKDDVFFESFAAHTITIAPGDNLEVELKIIQAKDSETGLYFNKEYEIQKVIRHNSDNNTQLEIGF